MTLREDSFPSNPLRRSAPTSGGNKKHGVQAPTLKGNMLALSSGDLGKWALEAVSLPRCDLWTLAPPPGCWQIVCSCGWVTSVFRRTLCFGLSHHKRRWWWRRRRLGKPRTKASLSRLEYESRTEEKTDGDEIVKLSGKAYPPFAISKALFCCFQNVNYLLGSAARGRSSCNNTERADNKAFMVQFLQWNGNFFFW